MTRRRFTLPLIGGLLVTALVATILVQTHALRRIERALTPAAAVPARWWQSLDEDHQALAADWQAALSADPAALARLPSRLAAWAEQVTDHQSAPTGGLADVPADARPGLSRLAAFNDQAMLLLDPSRTGRPDPAVLQRLLPALEQAGDTVRELRLTASLNAARPSAAERHGVLEPARVALLLTIVAAALGAAFAVVALRRQRASLAREQSLRALTDQLQAARQTAEAANQAKSQFLAHMSHEIRTPVQSVLGMLSLLRESGLSARQADHVRLAMESADHLLSILNDILDLSQLEAGRLTLQPAPLDLRAALQQVEALMRPQANAKSLALHVDAEPSVPQWIVADGTRLKQVVLNLLSNAIKFSDRGSVSLDVRLLAGSPECLAFVVTDTGIGMDATTRAGLFSGSKPAPTAAPRRHDGQGMGLDISRHLARCMGGDITAHSIAGEGSRFRFEMPLVRASMPTVPTTPPAAPGEALYSLSVLVAEDHPVNREYLASLLESLHHRARFVSNGAEAVAAIQAHRFDLVLMDLHMPELDGIGATLAIRGLADRAAATVPIVALTADAFQETRDRCLMAGMNDFLTKPVSPKDLASALRRLYGQDVADAPVPLATSAPMPALQDVGLIDESAVQTALQAMSAERLGRLFGQFLDQGPQTVALMRAAVRDGQPLELRVHAHAACGAALNLGLAGLAQTAQALHEGAIHLPAHEIVHLVQRYEKLLAHTSDALQARSLFTR